MSTHYTRCRKHPSASPVPSTATNASSNGATGSDLPQSPTPSPTEQTKEKGKQVFSHDTEVAGRSEPLTTNAPALRRAPEGEWTTEDVRTLAIQELSMPIKVKFTNKELAKGYAGVPWQTIKGIRGRKVYRDVLHQEQLRRRQPPPDSAVPARSKPKNAPSGGSLPTLQESSSPQTDVPSAPNTAQSPQRRSGRSSHQSPTTLTPQDIPLHRRRDPGQKGKLGLSCCARSRLLSACAVMRSSLP